MNSRNTDFYFNTSFIPLSEFEKIPEIRTETEKSRKLKNSLNELFLLNEYIKNDKDFDFYIFEEKLLNIDFQSNRLNNFVKSQLTILRNVGKIEDKVIKNVLISNNNNLINKLKEEINNIEVLKIIN